MTRRENQVAHLKERARERLGIELNRDARRALVADIQQGRAAFLRRQSNRVTLWSLTINGVGCVGVYDKQRKTLVTVWVVREERNHE